MSVTFSSSSTIRLNSLKSQWIRPYEASLQMSSMSVLNTCTQDRGGGERSEGWRRDSLHVVRVHKAY